MLKESYNYGELELKISSKTLHNTDSTNSVSHFEGFMSTDLDLLKRSVSLSNYGEMNSWGQHEYKGDHLLGLDFAFMDQNYTLVLKDVKILGIAERFYSDEDSFYQKEMFLVEDENGKLVERGNKDLCLRKVFTELHHEEVIDSSKNEF